MQNRNKFYNDRIKELWATATALKAKGDRLARLRLFIALVIITAIYLSFAWSTYMVWVVLVMIVIFFRLVQRHIENSEEQNIIGIMSSLSQDEVSLLAGNHSVFDQSAPREAEAHIYAIDLDIFGKGSLFQVIKRTVTQDGRARIIETLMNPPSDLETISRRKEAIIDLTESVAWRQRFYAIGSRSGESPDDIAEVGKWLSQPEFFQNRRHWFWIAGAISLVSTSFIIWMIIVGKFYLGGLIALLIVNTAIFQLFNKNGRIYFNKFGSRTSLFRKFAEMFQLATAQDFRSSLGRELRNEITHAGASFMKLSKLHNLAEQRANGLVSFVMNGLFLFDVWTLYRIENWRHQYKDGAIKWIMALGHLDLLNSCANFRFNHPTFTEAEVSISAPSISADEMGHPLIPVEVAVLNDYHIGMPKAHIITGSNMAGKSTFIRAVGLNVVLALNGLPVCARRFSCSIMRIASCIRITDSLEDHASYFKAELDRLGNIMDLLRPGEPHLVLLDEILRGTNSDDKRQGTLSLYRKLSGFNCVCLLATHDLVISQLETESPERFANFCFESKVQGTELMFDYKLRKGVSSSANATFLMKKLNLID